MSSAAGTTQLIRAGDRAWLADVAPTRIAAVARAARRQVWSESLTDVVPAASSILFRVRSVREMSVLGDRIRTLLADAGDGTVLRSTDDAATIVIPVRYDGDDLARVAETLCLTVDQVIEAHTTSIHTVGFFGFAPGFAYIDGLPESLRMPRRSTPRARVAPGLVAIAGTQSVVYPGGTPGGWHLIGSTAETLWNVEAAQPNRLSIGDRIVFEAVA